MSLKYEPASEPLHISRCPFSEGGSDGGLTPAARVAPTPLSISLCLSLSRVLSRSRSRSLSLSRSRSHSRSRSRSLSRSLALALSRSLSLSLARSLSLALSLVLSTPSGSAHRSQMGYVSAPFFFVTLVTGPRRSLSLNLSDTRVYELQIQRTECTRDMPLPSAKGTT